MDEQSNTQADASAQQNTQEVPQQEANPQPQKGFKAAKKGTKKQMEKENNALKDQLNQLQQSQQFLGQQLFKIMQSLRDTGDEVRAMANLLRCEQLTQGAAIRQGDSVMIDFSGILKETGKTFEGGHVPGSVLKLGDGSFLQEFEEQLNGMKVGEREKISVKFPDDYVEQLAGKEAEFDVKIITAFRPVEGDTEIQDLHAERVESEKEESNEESQED